MLNGVYACFSFYYGSHYSSMGIVLYYLLRLEPFTALHRSLQVLACIILLLTFCSHYSSVAWELPSSPNCKRWILGVVRIDMPSDVANTLVSCYENTNYYFFDKEKVLVAHSLMDLIMLWVYLMNYYISFFYR